MRSPDRIVRHRLPDRLFHWVMAASVLVLLGTGFLPILGVRFAWVTIHWIAGLVLTAAVLFHVVRALVWQEPGSMMIRGQDLRDAWRAVGRGLGRRVAPPGRPGKYVLLQKVYHHAMAVVLLTLIATGLVMMVKVDTPFWTRDPYWLSDATWGAIYVLHGLAAMVTVTLLMVHVYFALRPEKLWLTRSMIVGWITPEEYADQHDPERWTVGRRPGQKRQGAAGRVGRAPDLRSSPPS